MTTRSPSTVHEGQHLQLVSSDPFDFVAADGSTRFDATVLWAATFSNGADEERLVLQLLAPVSWHDQTIEFFVARERQGHGMADELSLGQPIECALVAVDRQRAHGPDPFDTSWWRGGLAVNATVRAV